ncbi:MAG: putative 4-hydroxybenzoyl-CoA thioesterase [uncultured Caballeronia sp.]|nr:MAG: putative 4-hydroxybenzoyl-CoA thioesterase [uncultured Caballeronia sp.]
MNDNQPVRTRRADYAHFLAISTRWSDNDVYGHINNVVYYSYFDTVVNEYLLRAGVLDFSEGETIGLVVETHCNFFAPVVFPEPVEAGLRVEKLDNTSILQGLPR